MDRIEDVPIMFIENIYDRELPKVITDKPLKVREFVSKLKLEEANCPTVGCTGTLVHKASQDRAADEGMNIRFICDKCKRVVR